MVKVLLPDEPVPAQFGLEVLLFEQWLAWFGLHMVGPRFSQEVEDERVRLLFL